MAVFKHLAYPEQIGRTGLSERFDNDLFLYHNDCKRPFASRAHSSDSVPDRIPNIDSEPEEFNRFRVCCNGNAVTCTYNGPPSFCAAVIGIDDGFDPEFTAGRILRGLRLAYELDPYRIPRLSALERYEDIVARTASFCGCLTDIESDRSELPITVASMPPAQRNSAFIAMALPAIALMFRRIAALRGFNFKVIFTSDRPCLAFSAKALNARTDHPELAFLENLDSSGGLKVYSRIRECREDESEDGIYVFSVAVCPLTCDPRGILRAPAWNEETDKIFKELDIEVKGKY